MKIHEFDYYLPEELIAQHPAPERAQSRLMLVDRRRGTCEHHGFQELPDVLEPHDLLVLNNTKVFPARLFGERRDTSASIEVLLLREIEKGIWEVLAKPSKKAPVGTHIDFKDKRLSAEILRVSPYGKRIVRFKCDGDFYSVVERIGKTPLPPYIKREAHSVDTEDPARYQTVYAKVTGSVAAPTAGLHFTDEILQKLQAKGIDRCEITLHVGYGTFQPLRVEEIEAHKMEAETYEIPPEAAEKINAHLASGRRIVAVGTTTTRVLEYAASAHNGQVAPGKGSTDLFIYPGYNFKIVSALLTNFHLPRSTLLMLVCAFAGKDLVMPCYQEAIREKYRFYSYGDCMLIT